MNAKQKAAQAAGREPQARPRRSLPLRLLLLTMSVVVVAEMLVQIADVARDRRVLLGEKAMQAYLVALSAAAPDDAHMLAQRDELLRASGIESIRLRDAQGATLVLAGKPDVQPAKTFDLRQETAFQSIVRGLVAVFGARDILVRIIADTPLKPGSEIEFVMHRAPLTEEMRRLDVPDALFTLAVASLVGLLLYLALMVLVVRPMRRLISSIVAFRADPEHGVPLEARSNNFTRDDEISVAGRELAAMQRELRAALWRNSRLAALGTVVAKVSHDVRGILTPALLQADRLQRQTDPVVRRAGETILQAVDRVIDLVQRTLDFARDGPPPPSLSNIRLHWLVAEAGDSARAVASDFELDNRVPLDLEIEADRNHLYRVLVNLMRNAAEARATHMRVRVYNGDAMLWIELSDNGPGLPDKVRTTLFRPFTSTSQRGGAGLGLAIARDLMLAHGGDIALVTTGPGGTTFRLMLPMAEPADRTPQAAETA